MINYNRSGYEIKRDLITFSEKISRGLSRPKSKFITQMLYGILAGNKVHISEIARSLNETIPLIRAKRNRNVIYQGKTLNIMDVANKYKGNYRMDFMDRHGRKIACDLRVMPLQSVRNLNLPATLATGYIGIMSSEKDDTIFMLELKGCSKKIYDVPKFIFYASGSAIERVLAGTHSGRKRFLSKKKQSQQLTLAGYFGIEAFG